MTLKVSFIKDRQGKKAGRKLAGVLPLMLSLFMLTACPAPGPDCIDADEWGQTEDITVRVDPKNRFNPTGISVRSGEPLSVEISGAVDLCPTSVTIDANTTPTTFIKPIKPSLSGWQDSGQVVTQGENLGIYITADTSNDSNYNDINGKQEDGRGLYAYIAPAGITPGDLAFPENGEFWYGTSNVPAPADNRIAMDNGITCHPDPNAAGSCNRFFELWDNGTTGSQGSGYVGVAPASGHLYFRYARTADARGTSNSGDGEYSPWKGNYRWEGSRCDACRQTTIWGTCAAAGPFWPICVAAWEGGCAGTGHLERSPSVDGNGYPQNSDYINSKCQEWYGVGSEYRTGGYWGTQGFDHFVSENAAVGTYNTGPGYKITISHGCPGTYGKYMVMDIGQSTGGLVPATMQKTCKDPSLCIVGSTGCTVGAWCDKSCDGHPAGCTLDASGCAVNTGCVADAVGGGTTQKTCASCNVGAHGCTQGFECETSCAGRPAGCTIGANGCVVGTGCEVIRDDFSNTPIMEPHFSVTPSSSTDMNSSGTSPSGNAIGLPAGFTRRGLYSVAGTPADGGAPSSGELWFEIVDGATESNNANGGGYYPDNIGSYHLHIRTTKVSTVVSSMLNGLIKPMRKIIFGYCRVLDNPATLDVNEATQSADLSEVDCYPKEVVTAGVVTTAGAWQPGITQHMYNILSGSSLFISMVRAAMILMVVIYAMLFMMGMIEDVHEDVIRKVIKFAIVVQLISPGSWAFFDTYLFTIFTDGMNSLIGILAGDFMGSSSVSGNSLGAANVTNPFAFVDGTMSKFLNFPTLAKILGLLFSSPLGIMYVLLMFAGIFYFLFAVLQATILYILAMLTISLLLVVAPIFISFLLFSYTKKYFDNWIKALINYLFQPVLVFTALSIFNVFVYSAIYSLLHYGVCWSDVFSFTVPFGDLGNLTIPLFKFYMPSTGHDGDPLLASGMPIGLFMIFIFIIITNAMLKFVDFMAELSAHLTTGSKSTSLSAAAAKITSGGLSAMKDAAKAVVKSGGSVARAAAKRAGGAKEGDAKGGDSTKRAGAADKGGDAKGGSSAANADKGGDSGGKSGGGE